jgi:exopolysaccharide biosynthesis polyprenyl glycosylphosphotransferase
MREAPTRSLEATESERDLATSLPASARAQGIWRDRAGRTWTHALLRRLLACADLAAVLIASLSLVVVGPGDTAKLAWSLALIPLWIVVAKLLGLYDRDGRSLRHLTVEETPFLVLWALIGVTSLSLFLDLTPAARPDAASAIVAGVVAAGSALLLRALARYAWRRVTPPVRVAFIGPVTVANTLRRKLELFPDVHATIVEVVDPRRLDEIERDPTLLVPADRVCFAPTSLDDGEVSAVLRVARSAGLKLSIIPPSPGAFGTATTLNHLAELPILEYNTGHLSRSTLLLKRALDVVVSGAGLIVTSPIAGLVALAILLDSRGPILFKQWRAGQHGHPFLVLKFRTMVPDAEEQLAELVSFDDLDEPVFKLSRDPRVTRVGRFLRRWSLDELPQLVNVLRGEMSLVGPRPEQVELVERYTPEQRLRVAVKPGLTGPMQVYGRGELTMEERLAVEYDYIENLSLGRDVQILGLTAAAIFRGKGAF